MGVDFKTYKWLKKNIDKKNLSMSVIGRQNLNLTENEKKRIGQNYFIDQSQYADSFLIKALGLSKLISFDKSDYENCDVVLNFEKNFDFDEKFDIFFDGGSLPHIYNIPKTLENIVKLTKIDGKIIHTVAFNNFQGFGLYQISPELLFSFYSKKNGFSDTSIYLVSNLENNYWYKIKDLDEGERYHFNSNDQLSAYIVTTKKKEVISFEVDQKFFLSKNITKKKSYNRFIINTYLYFKIVISALFMNFFLRFDKKLNREKID